LPLPAPPRRATPSRSIAVGLGVALVAWSASPAASAHPFGDRFIAQRLDVHVDRGGLRVGYLADVPTALMAERGGEPDLERTLDELTRGIVVVVDGATVPATVERRAHRADLISPHTRILELVLRADAPLAGRHRVEVSNGNLHGYPSFYFTEVEVSSSASVYDSSLLAEPKGLAAVDLSSRWTRSELRRRLTLDVELPDTAWAAAFDRIDGGRVPLAEAHDADPWDGWGRGSHTPAALLPALVGVPLAGALAGAAGPRRLALLASLATGLLALAVSALGAAPLPAGLRVGACAAAGLIAVRTPWPVGAVGAAVLALTAPTPWSAPLLAAGLAAAALGACLPDRARSRWLALAAVVVGGGLAALGPPDAAPEPTPPVAAP
jgi:hypothetical protein